MRRQRSSSRLNFVLANQVLGRNDEVRALRFPSMFCKQMDTKGPDPATAIFWIRNKCKTNTNGKCESRCSLHSFCALVFVTCPSSGCLDREASGLRVRADIHFSVTTLSAVEITGALEHKDAALCSLGHLALTLFERYVRNEVLPGCSVVDLLRHTNCQSFLLRPFCKAQHAICFNRTSFSASLSSLAVLGSSLAFRR